MSDRTDRVRSSTITVAPMPGRLAADYYDNLLKTRRVVPLADLPLGTPVRATGTVARVRYLDKSVLGRVMIVLTDDAGDSAAVSFAPEIVRMVQPVLAEGARISISGLATRRIPTLPAGIDGLNARMADL